MKVHFIAIGGSAMHNLALALHHKGYRISGSDDEIFEPSRGRLAAAGILPKKTGWHPDRISDELDAVILGMHAKDDNPELRKAKEIGLKIYSYPEFLYEQSKNKKRVVIAGSHGKTTITAMVMHVLKETGMDFDFMVGAQLKGFDVMVRLSETAEIMLFEGDEYLTSAIDPRPKFHLYKPHIALISGIAWDHINVFPTFDIYVEQFREFIRLIRKDGSLIYYEKDPELSAIAGINGRIRLIPYNEPDWGRENETLYLRTGSGRVPLKIFGNHNMQNLCGAMHVCGQLGIDEERFIEAISSFRGASRRLEYINGNEHSAVYLDFAHAPSKLKATVDAVKGHFPDKKVVACMELHTYSSLSKNFLEQYRGAMAKADVAFVYYNPHTLELKRLPPIAPDEVSKAFGTDNVKVFNDSSKMMEELLEMKWHKRILLLMSSGNFDGFKPEDIAERILEMTSL